jgi:hypothetical protein
MAQLNKNWVFRKLDAERNITPEPENASHGHLASTGVGASALIEQFVNNSKHNKLFIKDKLLASLNKITCPESKYESIDVKRVNNSVWEVFLQEENHNLFALSQSGSGLKTILLVLLNLLVAPKMDNYKDKKICYGFEELENNLHPALQRRLFDYIYDYAIENDVYVFLTTHSHVAINSFFGKKEAQIYHVTKEDNKSCIRKIENYFDKAVILDDLDVKASDLLQSNGIIWVEGKSDKLYINKWLEIFSDEKFEEGKHYQILEYGGKNISHFSADVVTQEDLKYINMLTINRNAAIVIDSDRKCVNAPIRATNITVVNVFCASGATSQQSDDHVANVSNA